MRKPVLFLLCLLLVSSLGSFFPHTLAQEDTYKISVQCDALYKLRGETVNILTFTNASSFRQVILSPSNATLYDQTRTTNMSFPVPNDADYGTYTVKSIVGNSEATTWLTVLDVTGWTLATFPHEVTHKAITYTFFGNWTLKAALGEDEFFIDMSKLREWSGAYGLDVTALKNSMNFLVRFSKEPYFAMDLTFSFIHSGMKIILNGTQDQPRDFTFSFNAKHFRNWLNGVKSKHIIFDWSDIPKSAFNYDGENKLLTVHIPESFYVDPAIFEDGFETGDFGEWTGTTNGNGGDLSVQDVIVYDGTYAAQFDQGAAGGWAVAYENFGSTYVTAYAQSFLNVTALPASGQRQQLGPVLFEGASAAHILGGLYLYNDGGTVEWDLQYRTDATEENHAYSSTPTPTVDTWYRVEIKVLSDGSAGEAKAWIVVAGNNINEDSPTISATGLNNNDYEVGRLEVGTFSTADTGITCFHDDVTVAESYIGPEEGGATEISEYGSGSLTFVVASHLTWVFSRAGSSVVTFASGGEREAEFSSESSAALSYSSGHENVYSFLRYASAALTFVVSTFASFAGFLWFYGSAALAFVVTNIRSWIFERFGYAVLAFVANGHGSFTSNHLYFYGSAALSFVANSDVGWFTAALTFYGSAIMSFLIYSGIGGLDLLYRLLGAEDLAYAALAIGVIAFALAASGIGIFMARRRESGES